MWPRMNASWLPFRKETGREPNCFVLFLLALPLLQATLVPCVFLACFPVVVAISILPLRINSRGRKGHPHKLAQRPRGTNPCRPRVSSRMLMLEGMLCYR
jgi:hypothetical protein